MDTFEIAWITAGVFALLAFIFSITLIYKHLVNYSKPILQGRIIRIVLMVPIYVVDSWLGLRFPTSAIYLDTLRDCYEAVVIYTFVTLMLNYPDGGEAEVLKRMKTRVWMCHPWPFCALPRIRLDATFIRRLKQMTLQYVLIQPITAFVALILQSVELYEEGSFRPDRGYLWLAIINNISISVALYFLVLMYMAMEDILRPYRPLLKFLCIKSVIFFTFWQGFIISALVMGGVIVESDGWTTDDKGRAIQNCLICLEMFIAAIFHLWAFSHVDFIPLIRRYEQIAPGSIIGNFSDIVRFGDIIHDTRQNFIPPTAEPAWYRRGGLDGTNDKKESLLITPDIRASVPDADSFELVTSECSENETNETNETTKGTYEAPTNTNDSSVS